MTKLAFTRDFYIPKEGASPVDCTGTDAAVYIYERGGAPCAIGFHGKAQKPDFHFRYRSAEARDNSVKSYLEGRKSTAEYKAKIREERTAPHTLKLGDILYTSWGYDQTNVDFYEVTRVIGSHSVEITPIAQSVATGEGGPSEGVVAVPGKYTGAPMMKRANSGNSIRIESYAHATKWDGRPKHQTGSNWGH